MMNPELERIRLLENRMRKKSRNPTMGNNDESIKSIKSTDSKKGHHAIKEEKVPVK